MTDIDLTNPLDTKDGDFYIIGKNSGTDKIFQHHYYLSYPKFFNHYRELDNYGMLEIGIEDRASLNLWLNYFPKAFIYGMDIHKEETGQRHMVIKGDQSKKEDLNRVIGNIRHPLFLILDDGSHIPEHQLLTFDTLFKYLSPGGTYVIEDVETSYWSKNHIYVYPTRYGYKNNQSLVETFKHLLDDVNRHFLTDENKKLQDRLLEGKISKETRDLISSITFSHNTIIITKKTVYELNCREKTYYWSQNL